MQRRGLGNRLIEHLLAATFGLSGLMIWLAPSELLAQENAPSGKAVTILDGSSVWRALHSWNAPLVKTRDGIKERRSKGRRAGPADRPDFRFMTLYPSSGWTDVDFEDSTWARRHFFVKYSNGEWDHRAGGGSGSPYLRQLSLRGRFTVTDPAKVSQLWLTMGYRGGAAVYLNGKELTRAHLPGGKLEPGSPAEMYPDKAYLKGDGKPWSWWNDRAVIGKEAYPLRVRTVEKLAIPANLLNKGTNVLAVEIHAAAYPEGFMKVRPPWSTCGLIELRVQTGNTEGIKPNVVRPKGVQVWNTNTAEQVLDASWGDPHQRLRPISMAAPRNGCCSGRVVVGSDKPMKNLRARMGDLVGPGGKRLPPSAVRVWYGRFDRRRGSRWGGAIDDGAIISGAFAAAARQRADRIGPPGRAVERKEAAAGNARGPSGRRPARGPGRRGRPAGVGNRGGPRRRRRRRVPRHADHHHRSPKAHGRARRAEGH